MDHLERLTAKLSRDNRRSVSLVTHLGFSLDGSTVFQQELNNADMAIPGSTVQRSQLILQGDEEVKESFGKVLNHVRDRKEDTSREDNRLWAVEGLCCITDKMPLSTFVTASICAPLSSSSLTIITFPLLEAM